MNEVTIGAVASVRSGYAFKSSDWLDRGIPVLKITNVKDGRIVIEGCSFVNEAVASQAREFETSNGDILISMTGHIGEIALVRDEGRMLVNQRVGKFFLKRADQIDPLFLFYALSLPKLKSAFVGHGYGAAQPNISPNLIERQMIPHPSLPTQRRIASILSAYDDLIENNRKRIALLEEMGRSLYREWFVHFRYPGHEAVPLVDSSLGPIPQRWQWSCLREIAGINQRQLSPVSAPATIRYIDIASVSPGSIDAISIIPFSEAPSRARRVVKDGDVLWSCVRPNRRSHAIVLDPDVDTIASTGFAVICAVSVPWTFLYQATTTDAFVGFLVGRAQGAAYPAVRAEDFGVAEILIPTEELLTRFNTMVEPWARLMRNLQRQTSVLRRTRDLLLPRLMSGTLSVAGLNAAEAAVP